MTYNITHQISKSDSKFSFYSILVMVDASWTLQIHRIGIAVFQSTGHYEYNHVCGVILDSRN